MEFLFVSPQIINGLLKKTFCSKKKFLNLVHETGTKLQSFYQEELIVNVLKDGKIF